MFLTACSGYIINKDASEKSGGGSYNRLGLVGGGYLSTDNFNEISPFLYRDQQTGNIWLFFSSDRDGGKYRIFFAKMAPDGNFYPPQEMSSNINVPGTDQTYPLVFQAYYYDANYNYYTNIFITFLSKANSNFNINTFMLDSSMSDISNSGTIGLLTPATGIGLIPDLSYQEDLLLYDGSANPTGYYLNNYISISWSVSGGYQFRKPAASGSGFVDNEDLYMLISSGSQLDQGYFGYSDYSYSRSLSSVSKSLANLSKSIKPAGYGGITAPVSYSNDSWDISAYASSYSDRDPFVDNGGSCSVYFASDRYGKGNYDLYRYNENTFDKSAFLLPPVPYYSVFASPYSNIVTNIQPDPITNGLMDTNIYTNALYWTQFSWNPPLGAQGYNIYYTTNYDTNGYPINFVPLSLRITGTGYLWQTNYDDFTDVNGYIDITVQVTSYNGRGESTFGGQVQYSQIASVGK